jgi:hypothetical protein
MNELMEKYVAKALEGYEANFKGVSDAISQMEANLETLRDQKEEMRVGIEEMKECLGLEEDASGESTEELRLVKDETAIE